MAAPHVAGLAALMLGEKSLTPAQVESTLKANVRAIPGSCPQGCGAGLVDAAKTIWCPQRRLTIHPPMGR